MQLSYMHSDLLGPFRLVETHTMWRAYESIMEVIKDRTDGKEEERNKNKVIDYYEAVKIAYVESG
jgi:hypothetical protein